MVEFTKVTDRSPSDMPRRGARLQGRFEAVSVSGDTDERVGDAAMRNEICELLMACHRMAAYLREDEAAEQLIALRLRLEAATQGTP